MKSFKTFIFIFLLFIISCCSNNNIHNSQNNFNIQEETLLEKVKLSAVKVSVGAHLSIKEIGSPVILDEAMDEFAGSGSIIEQNDKGTFILTAGHVCSYLTDEQVKGHFPYYDKEKHEIKLINKYLIIDAYGKYHPAILLALSPKPDTCILFSTTVPGPALEISSDEPRPSQRIYSISYPRGLWGVGFDPILEGFYTGTILVEDRLTASFSMRTTGGCSGGMIVDFDGKLVGMIHSYEQEFDQLSLGATVRQITLTKETADYIYNLLNEDFNKKLDHEITIYNEIMKKRNK